MRTSFDDKILDQDQLAGAVARDRQAGRTIVQCHGCFDIVHPGHIRYLEFARAQGDRLVVTLTGDSDISKGVDRPYIPQELRAENVAALMCVDYVCIVPEPTAEVVLGRICPDIYVKGREYEGSKHPGFLAEQHIVEQHGGRIIFSSGEIVFSSSKLIEQLPRSAEIESHRLNLVCRRHGIARDAVKQTLDRIAGMNVLVVGDMVMDRYVSCDAVGVASESPMLSLTELEESSYVGGAAIVARHLAALGARPFLMTAGGDQHDERTARIRQVLKQENVEAEILPARPAVVEKTRYIVDDTKLFKVDRAHRLPLDSMAERRASMILEQKGKLADAVIFCDFGYGMLTAGLLTRILPSLRQNVRTLSADVSGTRGNLLAFQNVDLLCPTERELRAALNDYDSGLSATAWDVLHATQARHLIVTLEKRGMVAFERRGQQRGSEAWQGRLKSESMPSFADRVHDRLGCGDALLALATAALAGGAGLPLAAYLGNTAAAIEIAKVGNVPVTMQELRDWLGARAELRDQETNPPASSHQTASSDPILHSVLPR